MPKIYTKTGDKGKTGLYGGTRISKADMRINAYGTVDELNSNLGMLLNYPTKELKKLNLQKIQSDLFVIGSQLAVDPEKKLEIPEIKLESIEEIEAAIDEIDSKLPDLTSFILPGGNIQGSFCHIARSVCRRCERLVVLLSENAPVDDLIIKYLNRLSDLLFVLARYYVISEGKEEIPWIPTK